MKNSEFRLPIVLDGIIIDQNLRDHARDRQWLINGLKAMGYEREDIPYLSAYLLENGSLEISGI